MWIKLRLLPQKLFHPIKYALKQLVILYLMGRKQAIKVSHLCSFPHALNIAMQLNVFNCNTHNLLFQNNQMPYKMTQFLLFRIKIIAKTINLEIPSTLQPNDILFGLMKIKNVFNYYYLLTFSRQKSSQTRNALNCTRCPTLIKITSLASIYQVIN